MVLRKQSVQQNMDRPASNALACAVVTVIIALASVSTIATAADTVRHPAVQGQFYPADANQLTADIKHHLEHSVESPPTPMLRALISPHAGFVYSGVVAAAGYRLVTPSIKRVIVLAPSHHFGMFNSSIANVTGYSNTLGVVPLAPASHQLRDQQPFINSHTGAHAREHSLEVQLPFLQTVLDTFTLIPIVLGDQDPKQLAAAILPLLNDETLLVASSDLSHYHSYDTANAMDRTIIADIERLDIDATATGSACGLRPILTLMHIARHLKWQPTLLDYRNSGDTAGRNNRDRVVGYASIAFSGAPYHHSTPPIDVTPGPSDAEKRYLLKLARTRITSALSGTPLQVSLPPGSSLMSTPGRCFVTLTKNGALRGCIGSLQSTRPLAKDVFENAFSAAFRDRRFKPLSADELDRIAIEVSILSQPQRIQFDDADDLLRKLRPGIDGLVVTDGHRRSTYLPQVWQQLPNKEEFLRRLCQKAGLPVDRWRQPGLIVESYQALKFSEADYLTSRAAANRH